MSEPIQTKQCSKCKQEKPVSEFYKQTSNKTGYKSQCKECCYEYEKERRKRPESLKKYKEACKRYQQTEKYILKYKRNNRKYALTEIGQKNKRKGRLKYRNSEKYQITIKRYNEENRAKNQARWAIKQAIKIGKMKRAKEYKCNLCNIPAYCYHHNKGYNPKHWLDVIPLCRKCHAYVHLLPKILNRQKLFRESKSGRAK